MILPSDRLTFSMSRGNYLATLVDLGIGVFVMYDDGEHLLAGAVLPLPVYRRRTADGRHELPKTGRVFS
jgi:hypothetical protein